MNDKELNQKVSVICELGINWLLFLSMFDKIKIKLLVDLNTLHLIFDNPTEHFVVVKEAKVALFIVT